ncbi:TonB-dependent receptor [Olivibacter jilunii]|uniref:TonB-dependent receptor n=1 Tax=Olivibacter jilunii TaxID=985016 RepID=UPI003F180C5F
MKSLKLKRYAGVKLFCMIFFWITCYLPGQAQLIRGTIVEDAGRLPGASLLLKENGSRSSTDLNGEFKLQGTKIGDSVTLEASYIGMELKVLRIQIQEGVNDLGTIHLIPKAGELNEVVINGTFLPSQRRAYAIQKNASSIMNVIAADAIGKLPDRNAAEAVQRVQGVAVARYHGEADQATVRGTPFAWTSTLLNGSRLPSSSVYGTRATVLDVVPSELIQYVQVAKAITPDIEGDAIGGSINFITKTAPAARQLGASFAGGYNTISSNATYNGSINYGDRFFNDRLGVMVTGAIWDRNWGADSYDLSYASDRSINNMMLKRYMGKRQTYGVNLGLEWKWNANHRLFVRGMVNKFNDIRPVYESYVDFARSRYQYNYRYSYYETSLNGLELGGDHQLNQKTNLQWSYSNFASEFAINTPPTAPGDQRGLPIATFVQPISDGFAGLSGDGKKYLAQDAPDGVGQDPLYLTAALNNPAEIMDPNKLMLSSLTILQLNNREKDQVGQLNLTHQWDKRLKLKAGFKFRSKQKRGINQAQLVRVPDGSQAPIALGSLQTEAFPNRGNFFSAMPISHDQYIIDPLTKDQLFDLYDPEKLSANGFRDVSSVNNQAAIYHGTEDVWAGYLMAEYDLSNELKIIGGVRNEYTSLNIHSSRVRTDAIGSIVEPVEERNSYHALLPMLHMKYAPQSQLNIRAAFTRTFARANFTDLIPNERIDATGPITSISSGNPALKPTFSNNFDLMAEYFFEDIGILSGGAFYKDLSNVIFTDRTLTTTNGTQTLRSKPMNLSSAHIFGVEGGINKRFDFFNGFFSGFGVELNYTYTSSEAELPRLQDEVTIMDKISLPNQSKHLFNSILYYERNGIMVRLAGNFRGKSVETIDNTQGPRYYIWTDNNFTVDGSATVNVNKHVRLFLEINNITNEPLRTYIGDTFRPTMTEWYGQRGQIGVRWDL